MCGRYSRLRVYSASSSTWNVWCSVAVLCGSADSDVPNAHEMSTVKASDVISPFISTRTLPLPPPPSTTLLSKPPHAPWPAQ